MSFLAVLSFERDSEDDEKGEYKELACNIDLPFYAAVYDGGVSKLVRKIAKMLLETENEYETLNLTNEPEPLNQYSATKYKHAYGHTQKVFIIVHTSDVKDNVLRAAFMILKHNFYLDFGAAVLYKQANEDKLVKIDKQLEEIKHVMHQNIEELIARGEDLDVLSDKVKKLKDASKDWEDNTKELNSCWYRFFGWRKKKRRARIY